MSGCYRKQMRRCLDFLVFLYATTMVEKVECRQMVAIKYAEVLENG